MLDALEPLSASPAGYAVVIALGLLWGSFANVCIYRWPAGASVIAPGSHCTACKTPIRWYDNVPVLAWLWLRGRCRACGAPFSARYLVIEAAAGALFAVAWWDAVVAPSMFEPFHLRLLHFAVYAAFCLAMLVIAFIDLDHQLILDRITIPSIVVFYAASFAWPDRHWYEGLLGAIVGYAVPWTLGAIYFRIRHREAMGIGDSMLLAVVGALLGWTGVVVTLFLGSILGTLILIPMILLSRSDEEDAGAEAGSEAENQAGNQAAGDGAGAPAVTTGGAGPSGASTAAEVAADPGAHAVHTASEAAAPAVSGPADPGAGLSAGAPAAPKADPAEATEDEGEKPSVLFTEVPFGTFLALAAVLWLFAEPWIHIHFHLPGG